MEKWITPKNMEYYNGLPDGEEWTDYVTEYERGRYINVRNFGDHVTWCLSGTDERGNYFETDDYRVDDLETALTEAHVFIETDNEEIQDLDNAEF